MLRSVPDTGHQVGHVCTPPEVLEAACRVRLLPGTGHLGPNVFPSRRSAERIGLGDKEPDLRHFLPGTRPGATSGCGRNSHQGSEAHQEFCFGPTAQSTQTPPTRNPGRPFLRDHGATFAGANTRCRQAPASGLGPAARTAPCTWPGPCPWWPASPPPARAAPPSSGGSPGLALLTAGGVRSSLETAGREDQHKRTHTHTHILGSGASWEAPGRLLPAVRGPFWFLWKQKSHVATSRRRWLSELRLSRDFQEWGTREPPLNSRGAQQGARVRLETQRRAAPRPSSLHPL